METYRSGHNELDSKSSCRATGTWVRIPPSPLPEVASSVILCCWLFYLVFYEIIFHASADGMGYYRIGNQMFTVEEVKNMLCREIARQNPELNLSVE